MKKIIGCSICMLLITLVIPTSVADVQPQLKSEGDVDISISAGISRKDIGFGFAVDILNHKTEETIVFFNYTVDYLFRDDKDGTYGFNTDVFPGYPITIFINPIICRPDGIKLFTITVETEGTMVTRSGLSINRLVILYK